MQVIEIARCNLESPVLQYEVLREGSGSVLGVAITIEGQEHTPSETFRRIREVGSLERVYGKVATDRRW